ncbi:FtsK/SpoIIIE domain-containing protein [uncultured Jatrophihabitans sp.]|uniref:FtsK/SpoIIIE domain-containing protein n=1 Tax=uncultured Jatrophihabitans sp. TaxID=1610747 RepID=UPI0035C96177
MQIELTIRRRGACTDVAVEATSAVSLATLESALGTALACPTPVELWHDGRRLGAGTPLGAPGLRNGALLDADGPGADRPAAGVLALHRVGGPDAGSTVAVTRGRLLLGRAPDCDVVVADPDASRHHAVLDIGSSAISLRDCGSTNGTRVDGCPVPPGGSEVVPGQVIRIGDTSLMVRGPLDVPAALADAGDGTCRLMRSPRDVPAVSRREIVLPQRATNTRPRGVQWIAALVPALAGGAVAWLAHSPQFLLFALLSPVMLLSTSVGDRLHWRRSRRRDAATYVQRRAAAEREIVAGLTAERRARLRAAPDAAALLSAATLPGSRLWERRRSDADLLDLRLGIADVPSVLRVRDGASVRAAGLLADVPYSVALRDGPLGVCGPPDVVDAVVRHLVGQLATLHSPTDVGLTLMLGPAAEERWRWARWLPHLAGRVATTSDEWTAHVARLAAERGRDAARRGATRWPGPWQVLVLDRAGDLVDVSGLPGLLGGARHNGLSALCVAEDEESLPAACATVVRVSGATGTRAVVRRAADVGEAGRTAARRAAATDTARGRAAPHDSSGTPPHDVVLDTTDEWWASRLARGLAAISDAGADATAALPSTFALTEALALPDPTAAEISDRWASCVGGARTVVGAGADGPLVFDLVRDGPHALVAGTTGAGKSELLQSLVVGLAANHPPESVSFLLIDYKGGAAFADCARLPHTAGLVTDLDAYLTARALRSLHSELRRRERLFAEHGAADLTAYRSNDAVEALPRLVIVVDEFAALAQELPDFVHGLIGVAQRGRSLGVHLVLATQRPRSAVSAEIRANTALRVALRVTDVSESTDVIDAGDAATIDRRHPGRGYLRTGDSLVAFQGAYGGGPAVRHEQVTVRVLDAWRRSADGVSEVDGPTQLSTVVDAVCAAAAHTYRAPARSPWLPPLPAAIALAALDPPTDACAARVAVVDLPDEQRRAQIELDLRRGPSLLIVGSPGSGRTTALATVALDAATRLAPDELHLYAVDPSGALELMLTGLPHVATIAGRGDPAPALVLLRRLTELCGDGSAAAEPPARLLLIDSWDALTTSLGDADAAEATDLLATLLRAGPAARLTVVAAGGRSALMPRFAGDFGARILLALADRNDYGLAGVNPRDVPATMPPGRGLRAADGAGLHVVHAGTHPGPAAARKVVAELAARWQGHAATDLQHGAIRIRPLPQRITARELPRADATVGDHEPAFLIGVGGDAADPLVVRLFSGAGQMVVAGPPRSGRSTTLLSFLGQGVRHGIPVVVAAGARSPLQTAAIDLGVHLVQPQDDLHALQPPEAPALLVVDDCELLADTVIGEALLAWVRAPRGAPAVVVAGRADDLATSYRGLGSHVRRSCCGLLLRPGPVDGEILGARLPRRPRTGPPGRGVLVGDPAWGPLFGTGEPVPVQVALPDLPTAVPV